ncbi:ABC-type multidrug transport system, ATPase component [Myxococcus fulvus]|uniref:ABC transporter n=1 Tax=Myxococcus fulvus TaxID=33 RepID=A0A511TDQ0_MYXFU|nr:ABC transporter ATP-binding protein [Myxococcus fulvus]AKF82131.1 ABC transporter ATP-binding protein [Myxococcus fulvus 124B02]GEN11542.1 ABC transporter [Myxococcus fulvus]SEU12196.1 ABC-type multidrug transport system, ATPase component [Myxococcus fulvus]
MSELAIELFGITKRFGPKVAVNNVSFSVPRGAVYGLIGPNGAGKTTTFSMMCGYLYPSEGTLKVMDVDPTTPGALKGRLGALPQDAVLPPGWEVGALLMYWAKLSDLDAPEREAREALEKVGLMEAWNVQTQALSHGMAKRTAMAQALMGAPPLVLLDEPTAGLDPRIAAQVRQVIKDMKGRQTVVVSSHNLQELEELCDAAAILDKGTLAQDGSMSELTGQGAEFRVQIARGTVIPPEIATLPHVTDARLEGEHVLVVRFGGQVPPEEVISRVVAHLLQSGVLILGVSRGRRLEDRVLQLL